MSRRKIRLRVGKNVPWIKVTRGGGGGGGSDGPDIDAAIWIAALIVALLLLWLAGC